MSEVERDPAASLGSVAHRVDKLRFAIELCRDDAIKHLGSELWIGVIFNTLAAKAAEVEDAIRWIPVTERLPKEDCLVLVFDPELGGFGLATYTKGDGWMGDDVALYEPTHWMPLPAPPPKADK